MPEGGAPCNLGRVLDMDHRSGRACCPKLTSCGTVCQKEELHVSGEAWSIRYSWYSLRLWSLIDISMMDGQRGLGEIPI